MTACIKQDFVSSFCGVLRKEYMLGITTKRTRMTKAYYDGSVEVIDLPMNSSSSYVRDTSYDNKGPNMPLVNGFRMPTNLVKASDSGSPGIGGPATFSGIFHGSYTTDQPFGGYTQTVDYIVDLNEERHVRWRNAGLSAAMHHQLMNAARAQALINLKNRNISIGLMLAELHKSVNTLQGYMNDIVGGMVSVKRKSKDAFSKLMTGRYTPATERRLRRIRNRPDRAKERKRLDAMVGGEYLRFKYGVMPSVYDAQGLIKTLNETLADKSLTIHARSRKSRSSPVEQDFGMNIGTWSNPKIAGTLKGTLVTTCSVSIYATVRSDALRSLSKVGFDAGTVAELTWDLIPFSFLLDHVLPVADMIQAWSAMAGLDFKTGTESTHVSVTNVSYTGSLVESGVPYTGTFEYDGANPYRLQRNVISSPPFPMPYVVNPLSLSNAATWLSLLGALRK